MTLLNDFFSSESWRDLSTRVLATFSFAGIGTVAKAIPDSAVDVAASNPSIIAGLIEIFTLISYGMSILVAITVLCRFFIWYIDRNKQNKSLTKQ